MSSVDDTSSSDEDLGNPSNRLSKHDRPHRKSMKRQQRTPSVFDMDDSSSSSDEFERVPECLDDLTKFDFKSKITSSTSTVPEVASVGGSQFEELSSRVDYYDFTKILQSQEELKHVAEKMANYTNSHSSSETESKRSSLKERKDRKKRNIIDKPSRNNSANPDIEIDELLRVGEGIKAKPRFRTSKRVLDDSVVDEDMILVTDQLDNDAKEEEPTQDVEITIALPSVHLKRKKDRELRSRIDLARKYNESRRLYQLELHKASLLGYLSHGFFINDLANTDELHALALSVIPNKSFYPPSANTTSYMEKVTKWFNKKFPIDYSMSVVSLEIIAEDFGRSKASSLTSLVVMFVALCRQLGLKCRLLISLQPCPIRPPSSEMMKIPKETEEEDEGDMFLESPEKKSKTSANCRKDTSHNITTSKIGSSNSKLKCSTSANKKIPNAGAKHLKLGSASNKRTPNQSKKECISNKKKISPDVTANNNSKNKSNRKVLSSGGSDEEEQVNSRPTKKGVDFWAEVFIEAEEIWAPVDVTRGQVNNTTAIGNGVTCPLAYVVAWNSDGTVKDLTRRYSSNWLTTAPKLRTDVEWWKKALEPWAPRNTKLEKLENKKLDEEEAATPIPSKIQEHLLREMPYSIVHSSCKNHPFYALKRHLLKYEAIYPPDAKPIGFIRGEAVYSRVCVSELHTKETWMRQGKAVRVNEEPYKIVKARPKWDKVSSSVVKDLPLPLYGYWQVDDYIAPPAVDGIVPKNEYGNVEMYRPSMLPAGTVHLQVPGIAKVARKLGIDFAPAVVGWEYHCGSSHPCTDGIIVCKEHQDTLLDAWNCTVDNDIEKEKSKSHLRAVKNWKKLIRSVIIRRRLEKKYKLDLSKVNCK